MKIATLSRVLFSNTIAFEDFIATGGSSLLFLKPLVPRKTISMPTDSFQPIAFGTKDEVWVLEVVIGIDQYGRFASLELLMHWLHWMSSDEQNPLVQKMLRVFRGELHVLLTWPLIVQSRRPKINDCSVQIPLMPLHGGVMYL